MKRVVFRLSPFLAGLAIAAVVGGAAFGFTETLLKPRADTRLAASALAELQSGDAVASRVRLGKRLFRVRCQPLAHRHSLVTVGHGARLIVTNKQLRPLPGAALGKSAAAAIVVLAGCPRVLTRLLSMRVQVALLRGEPVPLRRHGRDYWIPITIRRPLVVLEVNARTLEPVGVRFYGRVLNGASLVREVQRRKVLA